MRVIADPFVNATSTLDELLELEGVSFDMHETLAPYSSVSKSKTLARFVAESSTKLRGSLIKDFAATFPNIQGMVVNGTSSTDNAYSRLHDACFKFDEFQRNLVSVNCVLMDDKARAAARNKIDVVIADLVIFICVQFKLYDIEQTDEVTRSIQEVCDRRGITPSVLYGMLLQDLDDVGGRWYAYEKISPFYESLNAYDPILASECEEALYPLTDEMAEQLLDGKLSSAQIRGGLVEYSKGMKETEVDIKPSSLISRMRLD